MICPKCGRNNEGNICPYCDEPEIFDRTDDYLRRKEAFGKPQEKPVEETEADSPLFAFFKRRWPVLAVIVGASITAAVTLTNLPRSFHGNLSFISHGKLIRIDKGQPAEGTDISELIFSADGTAYENKLPQTIRDNKNLQLGSSYASGTGAYFAHTAYDSDTGENILYLWDKNGDVKEAFSGSADLDIKYVSDSGYVVFTGTDVLNDQWYTGETAIYTCSYASDPVKTVCKSAGSFIIYPDKDRIIYLDKDGILSLCSISDPEKRTRIADGVSVLFGEVPGENNRFDKDSGILNEGKDADLFCYCRRGEWIISNTSNEKILDAGETGKDTSAFVYDSDNRIIYVSEGGRLSKAVISDNGPGNLETVAYFGEKEDFLWDDHQSILVFSDNENNIMRLSVSGADLSGKDAVPGTLIKVENDAGYMYISGEDIYYGSEFKKGSGVLTGAGSKDRLTGAAADGGVLYYVIDRHIFSIDKNGGEPSDLGVCSKLIVSG